MVLLGGSRILAPHIVLYALFIVSMPVALVRCDFFGSVAYAYVSEQFRTVFLRWRLLFPSLFFCDFFRAQEDTGLGGKKGGKLYWYKKNFARKYWR